MAGWFTSRINASVVPAAPVAEPQGIGETVSALGRTAGGILDQNRQTEIQTDKIATAIAEREKARQQDKASSGFGVDYQASEGDFERYYTDVRNDPDAYSKIDARIETDKAMLRAKLGNDQDLINHWNPILEKMAQSRRTQAYQYIAQVNAKASAMAADQALTLAKDNARAHPERMEEFAAAEVTRVTGDSTIPAAWRPGVAASTAAAIRMEGLTSSVQNGNSDWVEKALDTGAFDGKLPDGAIPRLKQMIEASRGAVLATAKEQVQTWEQRAADGLTLSEGDIAQAAAARDRFRAGGDTSTAEKLQGLIADNVFAKQYEGILPTRLQNDLATLAGKADQNEADLRQIAWLRKQIGPRSEAFRADPKGFFTKYGSAASLPPPLNLDDQASVDATARWARARTLETGIPISPIDANEAFMLKEQARQGVQGRGAVLAKLDRFPDDVRAAAADKIMPNDAMFQQEAQMRPDARGFVYNGRKVLEADKKFLTPDKEKAPNAVQLIGVANHEMDMALRAVPADNRNAIKQTSGQWLAGWLAEHGRSVDTLTPSDIRLASQAALGGRFVGGRQIGGIAHARNDTPFVLPDTMSELDFWHSVDRDAGARKPDEQPAFSLRLAAPVWIGGGHYR